MYTTNMSTAESQMTYSTLAKDCEDLAAIARNMEAIASEKDAFRDDPKFQQLRTEFRAAWQRIHSLEIAI